MWEPIFGNWMKLFFTNLWNPIWIFKRFFFLIEIFSWIFKFVLTPNLMIIKKLNNHPTLAWTSHHIFLKSFCWCSPCECFLFCLLSFFIHQILFSYTLVVLFYSLLVALFDVIQCFFFLAWCSFIPYLAFITFSHNFNK